MKRFGTERIADVIKQFLLEKVNAILPEYEDEKISLPLFTDKSIVHGAVDATRISAPVMAVILIDRQTEVDDGAITEHTFDTEVNVVIICSGLQYEALVPRVCRYASALKRAMFDYPTFQSKAYPGAFIGSGFGSLEIDYDAGAVGGQMTAASLNLTVRTDELTEE